MPVGLITTFTAEMVAGGGGMGATLIYSQRFFESPTVFAYIVVMLAIGLCGRCDDAALSETVPPLGGGMIGARGDFGCREDRITAA